MAEPLGKQCSIDLHDCSPVLLDDPEAIEEAMVTAARSAGATVVGHAFHRFAPQGVSGVLILAESHAAVHTWPEHGFAAIDVFTCGPVDPRHIARAIERALGGTATARMTLERGRRPPAPKVAAP